MLKASEAGEISSNATYMLTEEATLAAELYIPCINDLIKESAEHGLRTMDIPEQCTGNFRIRIALHKILIRNGYTVNMIGSKIIIYW